MAAKRRTPLVSRCIITIRLTSAEQLELDRMCTERSSTRAELVRTLLASAAAGDDAPTEDGGASVLLAAG